tara:strand:+ start:18483 stop:18626 length:144 start_codon:yes stop_codon:yes gene_type:complete
MILVAIFQPLPICLRAVDNLLKAKHFGRRIPEIGEELCMQCAAPGIQ